ncbi:Protein N-acetyltransferase, RimJ/RimL family [Paenibacillus uliginis N3/975]|uniref:Protein N-acetyltransferase, RimJ/RimL family n=1 Tax=Paenibacillus uliginis N3/975 TaxID=1313296 RepID=A0A1X7HHB4_9BACL|nr:GNAT family N-acetyltransferase [Paenibacillus uliginis]SMF86168.1 Protein N-acetyltransferase, RimJ/RimL family [Paenibacillus uliginis N3/975]
MYLLSTDQYVTVQPLFEELMYDLRLVSLLQHTIPGEIYVDCTEQPSAAMVWDRGRALYVTGCNVEFFKQVNIHLRTKVFPGMVESNSDMLDYYIRYPHSLVCMDLLEKNLINGLHSSFNKRRYYLFDLSVDVKPTELPEGYHLQEVNLELLQRTDITNPDFILDEIHSNHMTAENFNDRGFGYCILTNDNEIVSWCLTDYVIGNRCEIGIETDEDHRQKGLATAVASACVQLARSKGIERIGWDCFDTNIGSWKTAEKVGFKLFKTYDPWFGWFNRFDNYLVQAYECYQNKDFSGAVYFYELVFDRLTREEDLEISRSRILNPDNQYWFYYNAARCYAQLDQEREVSDKLMKSVSLGLDDPSMITNEPVFDKYGSMEWFGLLLQNSGDATEISGAG